MLAQQVMVAPLDRAGDPGAPMISPDKRDGCLASRRRLLDFVVANGVEGLVVLTGDAHNNRAADLTRDVGDPRSRVLGSEFVATSIATGGDGSDRNPDTDKVLAGNPHVRFFDNQRG